MRRYTWSAALALLLASWTGAEAADLIKLRLAQNLAPISGTAIVAKSQRMFEKHGLDVAVSNFTSGRMCVDTMLGGGADIATTAEAPVTAAAMSNQPIAFVTGIEYSDVKTLTLRSAGIATLPDLKGKRIAFTAGTGSEVYTSELLKKVGLTAKDVTLVNLQPQQMIPALAAGSIDAFNSWEPHIANGKKALGDKTAELNTRGVYRETFNIVTTQPYLKANPKVVEAFVAALLEAEDWIKAKPEEAQKVIAAAVNMGAGDLREIWSDYVFEMGLGPIQTGALSTHARWRLDTGNHPPGVTAAPDFAKFIFPETLRKLAPARVTYGGG